MIETLTPEKAAEELRSLGVKISPETIRKGLQQKTYPFGDYVDRGTSPVYFIYRKLFDEWVKERLVN